jgi:hypothetical protein
MEPTTLPSIWAALGSSLLQFLWQGAVIGLVAARVLELPGKGSATVRFHCEISHVLRGVGEWCSDLYRDLFELMGHGDPILWRQRYECTLQNQF